MTRKSKKSKQQNQKIDEKSKNAPLATIDETADIPGTSESPKPPSNLTLDESLREMIIELRKMKADMTQIQETQTAQDESLRVLEWRLFQVQMQHKSAGRSAIAPILPPNEHPDDQKDLLFAFHGKWILISVTEGAKQHNRFDGAGHSEFRQPPELEFDYDGTFSLRWVEKGRSFSGKINAEKREHKKLVYRESDRHLFIYLYDEKDPTAPPKISEFYMQDGLLVRKMLSGDKEVFIYQKM